MKTGLIFGGGGARGVLHPGYCKALEEKGIHWDLSINTSVGSLNAPMFHVHGSEFMIEIWKNLRTKDICKLAPWNVFSNRPAFYDTSPLRKLINKYVDLSNLKANPKELYINTTDIANWTAKTVEIHSLQSEEDLVNLMMQSSAAPIAFPAVDNCCDGGLTANYAIPQAVRLGCDRIIILGVSVPEFSQVKTLVDAFEAVASIPEYAQLTTGINMTNKLNSVPGFKKIEIIVIAPKKPTGINLLDFDLKGLDRDELINYGYTLAVEALNNIKV